MNTRFLKKNTLLTVEDGSNGWTNTNLFSFQLTNSSESAFNVYILTNVNSNYDDANGYPSSDNNGGTYTLSSNGSSATITAGTTENSPVYLEFKISGATTSNTFTLSGYNSGYQSNYQEQSAVAAGVTFQAVPEPTTFAMMVCGLGMLLGMQKIRSRKS